VLDSIQNLQGSESDQQHGRKGGGALHGVECGRQVGKRGVQPGRGSVTTRRRDRLRVVTCAELERPAVQRPCEPGGCDRLPQVMHRAEGI
jgi:hypothetical protein